MGWLPSSYMKNLHVLDLYVMMVPVAVAALQLCTGVRLRGLGTNADVSDWVGCYDSVVIGAWAVERSINGGLTITCW